ncbi:MAG: cyclic nucleotide-binding domain-containing protein [Methylococcaceae bacterium]|nr:cyclic nucleotide-binding domain-containing protein [Methylococcaceae bacterium]
MSNQSITEYLSNHAFFSELNVEVVNYLCQYASVHKIKKGQTLFRQGEPADKFYIVRSGQISIQIPALLGPTLEIQTLGKDQVLGWSWLISPYQWSFQAKTEENTELLEFDGTTILARCEQDPQFGYVLLKRFAELMAERLDAARLKMMDEWNPAGFA